MPTITLGSANQRCLMCFRGDLTVTHGDDDADVAVAVLTTHLFEQHLLGRGTMASRARKQLAERGLDKLIPDMPGGVGSVGGQIA